MTSSGSPMPGIGKAVERERSMSAREKVAGAGTVKREASSVLRVCEACKREEGEEMEESVALEASTWRRAGHQG